MYFFSSCDSIGSLVFETVVFLCRLLYPENETSKLLFVFLLVLLLRPSWNYPELKFQAPQGAACDRTELELLQRAFHQGGPKTCA